MLKIKDEVDLKELEKFGFKKEVDSYYKNQRNDYIINLANGYLKIHNEQRWVCQDGLSFLREDEIKYQNVLYDLIKEGLVEKVEEWKEIEIYWCSYM